jgi:hypothetical protein
MLEIRTSLEGTEAISFQIESKDARYRWIQHALVKFRYMTLSKANKGRGVAIFAKKALIFL